MKTFKEVNLEAGRPYVADAISHMRSEINKSKKNGGGCILFIHGYGSSGVGGGIGVECRNVLDKMKSTNTIKNYIKGEDFTLFNFDALALKNRYKELTKLLDVCNHGVTVVEI